MKQICKETNRKSRIFFDKRLTNPLKYGKIVA